MLTQLNVEIKILDNEIALLLGTYFRLEKPHLWLSVCLCLTACLPLTIYLSMSLTIGLSLYPSFSLLFFLCQYNFRYIFHLLSTAFSLFYVSFCCILFLIYFFSKIYFVILVLA